MSENNALVMAKLVRDRILGEYWSSFAVLYEPRYTRSGLSRPKADILPVRPLRLVNKIYVKWYDKVGNKAAN